MMYKEIYKEFVLFLKHQECYGRFKIYFNNNAVYRKRKPIECFLDYDDYQTKKMVMFVLKWVIIASFHWAETNEGFQYWSMVSRTWMAYVDSKKELFENLLNKCK